MNNCHNTTSQLQESQQQQQQQLLENKIKKKKCRGDRRKQRYRRQLYERGVSSEEVERLVQEKFPSQKQQQQQQLPVRQETTSVQYNIPLERITLPLSEFNNSNDHIHDDNDDVDDSMKIRRKRKRVLLTPTPTTETTTILDQPLSQLSISQADHSKKAKITTITTNDQCIITENSELSTMTGPENSKPSYLKVPDRIFKQTLSDGIDDGYKIVQCLNTQEKLQFIRQISEITNNFYFKDLQRQLWKEYDKISLKDDDWESKITNQYVKQHNTCRMYKPRKSVIQQHLKTIQSQLERIGKQLEEYITMLQTNMKQWQPYVNPDSLSHAINQYVVKGQQRLKENYNYKIEMISLDWNDHQLIKKFYQLKPTEEQIELAKKLWQATADELRIKEQLEIIRQRISLKRLPAKIDQAANKLLPNPSSIEHKQDAHFTLQRSKATIQYKSTLMKIEDDELESIIRHHNATFTTLQDQLLKLNKEKPRLYTHLFLDTIEERRQAMIQRFFRIRENKLKTFFDEAPTKHRRSKSCFYTKITASLPFIDTSLNLTPQEISILIKGLKYIIPCQSRFYRGRRRRSRKKLAKIAYEKLLKIVKKCLDSNRMSISDERAKQAFKELETIVYDNYRKSVSRKLYRRAQHENKQVKRLQQLLRSRPDIIICQIDKSPGFYIGNAATMTSKVQEYMKTTKAYEEIPHGQSLLADHLHTVQTLLDQFLQQKAITKEIYDRLYPKDNDVELAHLHALPKIHKLDIPIRAIIACIHAPATLISKFLNHLLAPIYLLVARETTFTNSIDVIRQLQTYVANGYLTSTTKFITADVKNLYTMIPRKGALEALIRFLEKYSIDQKIGTLNINTIFRMALVVLDTSCFVYQDKYYKQIHGGAMGSAFTQVLANIYMLEWEQDLIQHQTQHKEIYGRYIDDIFMTANQSLDDIQIVLNKAKTKDINIEIEYTMDTSVNYLDATITNQNGQLRTCVYHKPTAELYYLPYTSDHPHKYHRNIPYSALIRAARLCSHVEEFNSERLRIDIALLLSDYPPKLITEQFLRFFQVHNAMSVLTKLDEHAYQRLHQQLLNGTTQKEKNLNNNTKDPIKYPAILQKKQWDRTVMYPEYRFESGPMATFSKKISLLVEKTLSISRISS